jgi:hypothetical protein
MDTDTILWILAILCFAAGAYGTYKGRTHLVAVGWIGFILAALTFVF